MPSAVQAFLEGAGVDHRGRNIDDVLAFDDAALEAVHDYIQWLFPLREASAFNPLAPVLSPNDVAALRASAPAQSNLISAAHRMQRFYEQNPKWLTAYDHNHLRITRIIRSLSMLAGHEEAQHFHSAIERMVREAGNPVAKEAQQYWSKALKEA
jgi:hypothetical protein